MKQIIQNLNTLLNMDNVDTYSINVTKEYSSIRTHIRKMSDIIVCILTVTIQHSTSNAGHSAGVDQVMIHWCNISPNPRLYWLHCCQEGNNC